MMLLLLSLIVFLFTTIGPHVQVQGTSLITEQPCCNNEGKLFQIPEDDNIVLTGCYNKNKILTYYTEYRKQDITQSTDSTDWKNEGFGIKHSDVNEFYQYSGYQRGHLAPAADFETKSLSYLYLNSAPQDASLNMLEWKLIEKHVSEDPEVAVGSIIYKGTLGDLGRLKGQDITIPMYFYKCFQKRRIWNCIVALNIPRVHDFDFNGLKIDKAKNASEQEESSTIFSNYLNISRDYIREWIKSFKQKCRNENILETNIMKSHYAISCTGEEFIKFYSEEKGSCVEEMSQRLGVAS